MVQSICMKNNDCEGKTDPITLETLSKADALCTGSNDEFAKNCYGTQSLAKWCLANGARKPDESGNRNCKSPLTNLMFSVGEWINPFLKPRPTRFVSEPRDDEPIIVPTRARYIIDRDAQNPRGSRRSDRGESHRRRSDRGESQRRRFRSRSRSRLT